MEFVGGDEKDFEEIQLQKNEYYKIFTMSGYEIK